VTHALEHAWPDLARGVGLAPGEPALLALSGGADSVALLLLARSTQPLVACHVDHGLRPGSGEDARACAALCRRLGVPLVTRRVELDPHAGDLERRAREARYRALAEVAAARALPRLLVAHQADDADETLLLRLARGTHPAGAAGLRPRAPFPLGGGRGPEVLRPLLSVRGGELRTFLEELGVPWSEDPSNLSWRFTRNRVRHGLLPLLDRAGGRAGLGALARELSGLEEELLRLAPAPALVAFATLGPPRVLRAPAAALSDLPGPLARRALGRLVLERTGRPAREATLEAALEALRAPESPADLALRGGHRLRFGRGSVELVAPPALPPPEPLPLTPGEHALSPGRRLCVEERLAAPDEPPPRRAHSVELHLPGGARDLVLRAPRPGDRMRPLGAPGSRPLRRVLADAGVPAEDRARLALVAHGDEVLWASGVRLAETVRVRPGDRTRLRLTLTRHAGADDFALPRR
jgi:tRNA(Ile)-lysidine synthase